MNSAKIEIVHVIAKLDLSQLLHFWQTRRVKVLMNQHRKIVRFQQRWAVQVPIWLVIVLAASWVIYIFAGPNRHTVVPGKIYRCSQQTGRQFEDQIRSKGIRTILNLRGYCPGVDWYEAEQRAVSNTQTNLEDVTMSAKCLPAPGEVRRIIDVFDHAEYPILIHCKEGKDRTGLAAAMALLLYSDATLNQARRQLLPIYGHLPVGRTVAMDEFFDRYELWLTNQKLTHSPSQFRDWALHHYIPGVGKAEFAISSPLPATIKTGTPFSLNVKVTNRSADTWDFQPGSTAAIHLDYVLLRNGVPVYGDRAGLFRKIVLPGESVEFNVTSPPLREPGQYQLKLEMQDYRGAGIPDRAAAFSKYGDDPLELNFKVE